MSWTSRVDVRLAWFVGGLAALLNALLVAGFAVFAISEELEEEATQLVAAEEPAPIPTLPPGGTRYDEVSTWTALRAGPDDVLVYRSAELGGAREVGLPLAHFVVERRELIELAVAVIAIGTVASIGFGAFAARRALAPVRALEAAVDAIAPDRLGARVPERGSGDDVDALAASINAVLARLEWAFERLAGFSADVAHELRTPINRVLNESQLALLDLSNERRAAALGSIHESAERMGALVNQLLLLASGEEGRLRPVRERVDLGAALAKLVELYAPVAEGLGKQLELETATAHWDCDRGLVEHALANLIENAVLHAEDAAKIRVVGVADAGGACVGVLDSGPGIPAADRERVFDRFVRLDAARSGRGSGLGLPIARMIARLHGGELWIDASPLGGAAFWMRVPDQPIGA